MGHTIAIISILKYNCFYILLPWGCPHVVLNFSLISVHWNIKPVSERTHSSHLFIAFVHVLFMDVDSNDLMAHNRMLQWTLSHHNITTIVVPHKILDNEPSHKSQSSSTISHKIILRKVYIINWHRGQCLTRGMWGNIKW